LCDELATVLERTLDLLGVALRRDAQDALHRYELARN
jgi:hypothetical protein